MKKCILIVMLTLTAGLYAQEVEKTTVFIDGIETVTSSYIDGEYNVLDTHVDGVKTSHMMTKDGISVSGVLKYHKSYGKYIAIELVIYNNTKFPFNFIPSENLKASSTDGKKTNVALDHKQYLKVVKRRQGWNAGLMALAQGMAGINDGVSYSQTTGNVSTNSYASGSAKTNVYGSSGGYLGSLKTTGSAYGSSNTRINTQTVSYNATEARLARQERNAQMSSFINAQASLFGSAKDNYLKSNTVNPGSYVAGHILIPKKGLGKRVEAIAVIKFDGFEMKLKESFKF